MLNNISTNLIIQYVLVGAILAGAVAWVIVKSVRRRKGKGSACCGCALSDHCSSHTSHSRVRKDPSGNLRKECPERKECCK